MPVNYLLFAYVLDDGALAWAGMEWISRGKPTLLGACSGEHVLRHDGGDRRYQQRTNQKHDLFSVHGEIASPEGPRE